MKRIRDDCVNCPAEMGCVGEFCPYTNISTYYCDACNYQGMTYRIDGNDYCENCAEEYLNDVFNELDIEEKARILDICIQINE